jgi:phosphatidylserine/phosphatidylglycerophosphate/cardiolipin synthase-like enzyme
MERPRGPWRRWLGPGGASGAKQELPAVSVDHDPWPQSLKPDFRHCCVGIARTAPGWGEAPAYAEGAVLTVDALKAAKHCIYIEAQYLTADFLGEV